MTRISQQAVWTGSSGKAYSFFVYPVGTPMQEIPGVYIYARLGRGLWIPVYIGQGDLSARSDLKQHQSGACIASKGASHFHARVEPNSRERLRIEDDLLLAYPAAYSPNGCNRRRGG